MISTNSLDSEANDRTRQIVPSVPQSRVVPRPVPEEQQQDPRGFELNQLRRRYNPREQLIDEHGGLIFAFSFTPSDPDFPFDLERLNCELHIPSTWPDRDIESPPALRVKNAELPRGFAINIEAGWDKIVKERRGVTLANMVRVLDNQLESFLSMQKAKTIKMVQFKDTRHLGLATGDASDSEVGGVLENLNASQQYTKKEEQRPHEKGSFGPFPREVFTKEQIAEAKARRFTETKQLEARMSRMMGFQKEIDGVVYTLPFKARGHVPVPSGLNGVSKIHLIIPLLYPLQPLRFQLVDASDDGLAEKVEDLFHSKVQELDKMNLMSVVNWLASNLGQLAREVQEKEEKLAKQREAEELAIQAVRKEKGKGEEISDPDSAWVIDGQKKGYVKMISRPPEWTFGYRSAESSESENIYEDDDDEESNAPQVSVPTGLDAQKGTALSFPGLQLHEVGLMRLSSLGIRVRCARCKNLTDVTGLKHNLMQDESCCKCGLKMAVTFRQALMHQNNYCAGYLDLVGCSAVDMLPSAFTPVCGQCDQPAPAIVCAPSDSITQVCRHCYSRLRISLTDRKLQVLTPSLPSSSSIPRKQQETQIWRPGKALPDHGACKHYSRSFRWFRFNCCYHVHPCDHCHDKTEDHVHEWADRMVCGFCGREGRYAPHTCRFCGRAVIGGGHGKGFWEGGKGTRDKVRMNKKDKRKYKRVGGGKTEKLREKRLET